MRDHPDAAQNLNRQWIGRDITPTACRVMRRQLAQIGVSAQVKGPPETIDDLRALKPLEFQNWTIERTSGTHAPRRSRDLGTTAGRSGRMSRFRSDNRTPSGGT